ncbi:Asp23/Gls24 family envelope stress response protein [Alkalibacter mobilis]|uniref:Asp23/Gls24 family envelope stress response protein n=1 Tax=Alkalibacter mobilis TaxID=2787712 RepID=UPI00189DB328|nr:Asp23/Gls24 family envelope stress response protein [Alkalibacter mobilis]MBF7097108.1 Asp23/Gls24 family envelope stress response protein [Alkalibacter mobilis]
MEDRFESKGNVVLSEDVISSIAALSVVEVEGVANLHQGFTGGIAEKFGKKTNGKNIRVVQKDNELIIDLSVDVNFGVQIQKVAEKIQKKVKTTVEAMTGSRVIQVNVNVEGVRMIQNKTE